MRLDGQEVSAIRASARLAFGPDATVRLFGSRVDDERKGGDIDLHVEVPAAIDEVGARSRFFDSLFSRIDEQRVDLIVRRQDDVLRGIDVIARRDGIVL